MNDFYVEKSIRNGHARRIFDRAMQLGTREAMAIAIYELKAEFELDEADIRDYVNASDVEVRSRAANRRLDYLW